MTDVTTDQVRDEVELPAADEQLVRELTERARTGGLKLTGEGGLPGKLTKMVIEGALEGELDDHPGYAKHDPEGRDCGNSRNGRRAKTVITGTGPVEISVPRDRDSSFEPEIVAKSLVTRGVVAFARESGVRRRSWPGLGACCGVGPAGTGGLRDDGAGCP
jgi:putative transposase